jgi:hypothetical protein
MKFEQFYNLVTIEEAAFRKSKNRIHLVDLPMFSIFLDKELLDNNTSKKGPYNMEFFKDIIPEISNVFAEARNQIGKLGFLSMHANVVIKDLSSEVNRNTGGGVAGYAHGKNIGPTYGKHIDSGVNYMVLDLAEFVNEYRDPVSTVVHEWAHLWMFNKSKAFQKAVKKFYSQVLVSVADNPDAQAASNMKIDLPRELEYKLLDIWSSAWKDEVYSLKYIQYLIAKRVKITEKNLNIVPNFVQVNVSVNRTKYFGDEIGTIEAGRSVRVIKWDDVNWVIDVEQDLNFGNTIPLNDIFDFFDKTTFLQELNNAVQKIPNHYKTEPSEDRNQIERILYNAMIKMYQTITSDRIDTSEWRYMIHEWVKDFIYPQLTKGSVKDLREYMSKDLSRFYSYIWADNPKKPKDLSVIDMMKKLYISDEQKKRRMQVQKEIFKFNLSGSEKASIRDLAAAVSQWPSSYGMSNDDEIWATGIELFFKLPMKYRKVIMDMVYQNR